VAEFVKREFLPDKNAKIEKLRSGLNICGFSAEGRIRRQSLHKRQEKKPVD